MDKWFHATFHDICNYFVILGFKLIPDTKRGHRGWMLVYKSSVLRQSNSIGGMESLWSYHIGNGIIRGICITRDCQLPLSTSAWTFHHHIWRVYPRALYYGGSRSPWIEFYGARWYDEKDISLKTNIFYIFYELGLFSSFWKMTSFVISTELACIAYKKIV